MLGNDNDHYCDGDNDDEDGHDEMMAMMMMVVKLIMIIFLCILYVKCYRYISIRRGKEGRMEGGGIKERFNLK